MQEQTLYNALLPLLEEANLLISIQKIESVDANKVNVTLHNEIALELSATDFELEIPAIIDTLKKASQSAKVLTQIIYPLHKPFIGRKKELNEIAQAFTQKNVLVIDSPFLGSGKSALAYNYWLQNKNSYNRLIWLDGEKNIVSSWFKEEELHQNLHLEEQINAYYPLIGNTYNKEKTEELFNYFLEALAGLPQKSLMIIDNANEKAVRFIEELSKNISNFDFLITLPHNTTNLPSYTLNPLSKEDAIEHFKIFAKQATISLEEEEIVAQICQITGFHPLIIELLAKSFLVDKAKLQKLKEEYASEREKIMEEEGNIVSDNEIFSMLYEKLDAFIQEKKISMDIESSNDFNADIDSEVNINAEENKRESFLIFVTHILTELQKTAIFQRQNANEEGNHTLTNEDIQDLLLLCFNIAELEKDAQLSSFISKLSVLPNVVLKFDLLKKLLIPYTTEAKTIQKYLAVLVEYGWLQYHNETENTYYFNEFLKPVIWKTLKININKVAVLVHQLNQISQNQNINDVSAREKILPYLERMIALFENEKLLPLNFYVESISTHNAKFRYAEALFFALKGIEVVEKHNTNEQVHLFTFCNNAAILYLTLKNYDKAEVYALKAIKVIENKAGKTDSMIGNMYEVLLNTYNHKEKYLLAIEYGLKALPIFKKKYSDKHTKVASLYYRIGLAYEEFDKKPKAIEYYLKALEIWEKILPNDHANFTILYDALIDLYFDTFKYTQAIKYALKQLNLEEKKVAKDLRRLAKIYKKIAFCYLETKNYAKAFQYMQHAIDIFQAQHVINWEEIIDCYTFLADVYIAQKNEKQGIETYLKVVSFAENMTPSDKFILADAYINTGDAYGFFKKWKEAFFYVKKGLAIYANNAMNYKDKIRKESVLFSVILTNLEKAEGKRMYEKEREWIKNLQRLVSYK